MNKQTDLQLVAVYAHPQNILQAVSSLLKKQIERTQLSLIVPKVSKNCPNGVVSSNASSLHFQHELEKIWVEFSELIPDSEIIFVPNVGEVVLSGKIVHLLENCVSEGESVDLAMILSTFCTDEKCAPEYQIALNSNKILLLVHSPIPDYDEAARILKKHEATIIEQYPLRNLSVTAILK